MAAQVSLSRFLLFLSLVMAAQLVAGEAGGIAVYWDQNGNEGSLPRHRQLRPPTPSSVSSTSSATASRRSSTYPATAPTSPARSGTARASASSNISNTGSYGLADARALAQYLWEAFLGFSFFIPSLTAFSTPEKKVEVSAKPRCTFPDKYMGGAIATGQLDIVWVQLYNNSECGSYYYSNGLNDLISSWLLWTASVKAGKVYMCLLAGEGAGSGYLSLEVLIDRAGAAADQDLPAVRWHHAVGQVPGHPLQIQ